MKRAPQNTLHFRLFQKAAELFFAETENVLNLVSERFPRVLHARTLGKKEYPEYVKSSIISGDVFEHRVPFRSAARSNCCSAPAHSRWLFHPRSRSRWRSE